MAATHDWSKAYKYAIRRKQQDAIGSGSNTPRVGLLIQPIKNTSVYMLFDQTFILQNGNNFSGDPFEPLTGGNVELGVKKEWFSNRLFTQAAVYNIIKNNVLTRDNEHPGFNLQTGQVQSKGIEVDVAGNIFNWLNIIANYAYSDAKITKDNNQALIGDRPSGDTKHIFNGWIKYSIGAGSLKNLGFGLGGSHYIDNYGAGTTRKTASDPQMTLPDFVSLNTALYYKVAHLALGLNIDNLTDAYNFMGSFNHNAGVKGEYDVLSLPGRNYRLSVTYKF